MRDILSKVMAGSMIAGAALLVTACGGGNQANNSADANLSTDVYNTDVPTDLGNGGLGNGSDLGNTGTTGTTGTTGNTSTTTTGGAGNSSTTTTTTTNTTTGNSSTGNRM